MFQDKPALKKMENNSTNKKIFISYRRGDSRGLVKVFYNQLKKYYGEEIFFDTDTIKKGEPFPDKIREGIENCQLVLPVIGPNWDRQKFIKRINDPEDFVRKELEYAKEYNKWIIPVFIDRDDSPDIKKLPVSIQQGIFDRNAITLSKDDDYWDEEIKRYQESIREHTGLEPREIKADGFDYKGYSDHICRLDRSNEFQKIKYEKDKGQKLFAASGAEGCGFRSFARRCSKELLKGANLINLNWNEYSHSPNQDARQRELCEQIAKEFSIAIDELSTHDLIKKLQLRFADHIDQPCVFYGIRRGGNAKEQSSGAIGEWWDTWNTLLGSDTNRRILVLLFTVPGWLQRFSFSKRPSPDAKPLHIGMFGNINRKHIAYWKDEREEYLGQFDQTTLKKTISRLFRFGRTRRFEKVESVLKDVLMQSIQS